MRAVLERLLTRVLERRLCVGGDEVAGLDRLEAVPLQELCVLCLQQSAGNSAGPEVDVASPLLGHGILDRHIGDLDAPAWP